MTPRPQLDEDQMARMEDYAAGARERMDGCAAKLAENAVLKAAMRRAAAHFRAMRCETMAKECEEALK